ncbi:MAG TPA: tetratricopeptide repeat protein [Pyrinomonadaceae bacterium]|nr:tetratricopeptide repeat protein [Pyrinomonadaceae bacterium]
MIGQTISHFRIIDLLGEGGMGVVYLAEDINLGRRVAMKFLSTTTKEYRARFLREARAVSALTHPNIATVFDYGETAEGKPYIVMELIEGEPLNEKLRDGSLPLPEAARIVSYIAEALGEAHRKGVVHRDVKPSNVVITARGQVKVLDFGLVKQISEQSALGADPNQKTLPSTRTRSDVIVGTPLYLSPEQATGRTIDGRSDLFALGVVLYECITGQSAFAGRSVIEIGAQVIHVTPVVPSKLNNHIPPELDRITMKAIEKKVEARYQTADELIEDLRRLLPNLDSDGYRRVRSTESLPRQRTHSATALTTITDTLRRPRLSLGTVIVVGLAVTLAGWGLWKWLKSPYQPTPVALEWYNKGTEAMRNGAFLQAAKSFEQAVAADPRYALAHARLAEVWTELDYADRAKDEMLKAQPVASAPSQLAPLDALYLKAIHATVTRDYPVALSAYQELVRLSPNNPQVYVDLARAYEKSDEQKKAIANYLQATRLDSQYPVAFLQLAILYGRQGDQHGARAAFDKTDEIYQANGNFEGQAEVAYQRGYLFNQLSSFDEARQDLQQALALARTTKNEYQQVKTLLKLGDVEGDTNNLEEARRYIREGLTLAQARSIDNLTKRGLVDLGNTFLRGGDLDQAEKYFTQSLDLSQTQKDPRNSARAWLSLGSLAERRNKPDEVIQYLEQALPFYQKGDYRKESIQARQLLARAEEQKGDYAVAGKLFQQALDLSQQSSDASSAGLAHEDIGLLFLLQGRYPEALQHFEASYAIANPVGQKNYIGLSLVDCANALWRLGNYDSAHQKIAAVSSIAENSDESRDLKPAYYLAMARMALSERKFSEAAAKAQQVITLAGTQNNLTIPATFVLGVAQALGGNAGQGQRKCQQAVEMAIQSGNPVLLAEALLSLAEVMIESGNGAGALKNALESQSLFAQSCNHDCEWRAWWIAARASQRAGDLEHSHAYSLRAQELLSKLQEKWGDDNYQTYLNRADVKFSREQLNDFLAGKS